MSWLAVIPVGILFLGFCGWVIVRAEREKSAALQATIATLNGQLETERGRSEVLMHTALEARGVAVVDPAGQQKRQLIAAERDAKRRTVAMALAELERKAAGRARDRDEAVQEQIETMARLAEQTRERAEAK